MVARIPWWAWSGDLLLYLVMRIGSGLLIVCLCLLRAGRYSHIGWLVAALALDIVMTASERMDREIFAATQGFLSGHNIKHLLAGALLATWFAADATADPLPGRWCVDPSARAARRSGRANLGRIEGPGRQPAGAA